jgi:acetoin utilization deacetylase AcuC-like enzyme
LDTIRIIGSIQCPFYVREAVRKALGIDKEKGVDFLKSPAATDDDLLLVHTHAYVAEVKDLARRRGMLSLDTPVNPGIDRKSTRLNSSHDV